MESTQLSWKSAFLEVPLSLKTPNWIRTHCIGNDITITVLNDGFMFKLISIISFHRNVHFMASSAVEITAVDISPVTGFLKWINDVRIGDLNGW